MNSIPEEILLLLKPRGCELINRGRTTEQKVHLKPAEPIYGLELYI